MYTILKGLHTFVILELTLAVNDVYEMFYFNVTLTYDFNVTLEQSKSFQQIRDDIIDDVKRRFQFFDAIIGFSHLGLISMFAYLIFK